MWLLVERGSIFSGLKTVGRCLYLGLSGPGVFAMKMLFAVLLGGVLFAQGVLAQDLRRAAPRRSESKANTSESSRDRLSRRFNDASPKLGELLPDVGGYTADGQPVRLRSLKGDYKVLVFGCLT
jgi:hypothetical protein